MKSLTYILIYFFLPTVTFGQYIAGRVTDSNTGKPIKDVHIYIDSVEEGTKTFSNGKFQIKFTEDVPQTAKIHFSHVSYKSIQIDFDRNKRTYKVVLNPRVNELKEVRIAQNRQLKPYLTFKKMKSMRSRLHGFGSALIGDKIYVVGGNASFQHNGAKETLYRLENSELSQLSLDQFLRYSYTNFRTDFFKGDLHVYNITMDSWERQKDVFKKRAYHNIFHYQNKLYVLGGIHLSLNKRKEYLDNTIEIFDLETGKTIVDETNPHQAANFSSFLVGDELIVLGGSTRKNKNGTKNYSDEVHLYKISEGYWYKVDSMPTAKESSGIRVNDKIYLIGGFNEKPLAGIEQFDINTRKWENIGSMFFGISNPALAYHNDIIYIYNNDKFLTLNIKTKELNEYFINIELQNSEIHIANNFIYLVGGLRMTEREIAPSSSVYRIAIKDFDTTQIRRSKILQ